MRQPVARTKQIAVRARAVGAARAALVAPPEESTQCHGVSGDLRIWPHLNDWAAGNCVSLYMPLHVRVAKPRVHGKHKGLGLIWVDDLERLREGNGAGAEEAADLDDEARANLFDEMCEEARGRGGRDDLRSGDPKE